MKLHRITLGVLMAGICLSLGANYARAQEEAEEEVTEDVTDDMDEGMEEESMEEEVVDSMEDDGSGHFPRFRWGISAYGGPIFGASRGGAGGMDLRLGLQINEMIGAYLQPMFLAGVAASADDTSASVSAMGLAGIGAMVEFDFIDLLYVGIGPELLTGGIASASSSTTGASASASTGPYFGIASRLGVALGSKNEKRRSCFTVGLDMHMVIYDGNGAFIPMIALGYDRF